MQNNLNSKKDTDSEALRDIIENDLIRIIKDLPSEELLNLYKSLSGLKIGDNNNLKTREENNSFRPEKDIVKKYRMHLHSQNKACSTIKDYLNSAIKFTSYIKKERIKFKSLTMNDIDQYLSSIRSRNISSNTYAKLINCIRSFLRFLYGREYIKKDFSSLLNIPQK